jgi:integrase
VHTKAPGMKLGAFAKYRNQGQALPGHDVLGGDTVQVDYRGRSQRSRHRDDTPETLHPSQPDECWATRLRIEEVRRWLAVLDANEYARHKDLPDLVRFLLGTGCRLGEALGVHWEDVDLRIIRSTSAEP